MTTAEKKKFLEYMLQGVFTKQKKLTTAEFLGKCISPQKKITGKKENISGNIDNYLMKIRTGK